MNADFHYYATYCASLIAGYSNEEAEKIAYSACYVDFCTATILKKCGIDISAATTQSHFELADFTVDILGLHEITRIWASFHFLPGDLYAPISYGSKAYKDKYRLICKPNSQLLIDTINLAKGNSLEAIGISMHILADTWAHRYFVGTTSLVMNNVDSHVFEIVDGKSYRITFTHNPAKGIDVEERRYINPFSSNNENSIMNLGHGRLGHLPDTSFLKYRYMPAWAKWEEVIKDNPSDYLKAFSQMVYALKFFRSNDELFELDKYDDIANYKERVVSIINKRQVSAEKEWKAFAEELAGTAINDFDQNKYADNYIASSDKEETPFNSFVIHSLKQKSMVTNRIYKSKNRLAGYSVEYNEKRLKGVKSYLKMIEQELKERKHEQGK